MQVVSTLHLLATVAMAGLIWFVQIVHYPLFAMVGPDGFAAYERTHTRRTTYVVAPLMLTEAGCAILLAGLVTDESTRALAWIGLVLLALLWASTALLQVPCHRRLSMGFDATAWSRLVATNWLRTLLWSARAVLAVMLLQVPAS